MKDFLGLMAASSRARVGDLRSREPLAKLRVRAFESAVPPRLSRHKRFDLMAEFKRRSPSAGTLGRCDVAARVTAYAQGGAAAVSVVTEPTQFGGELSHLRMAAETLAPLGVPVMRKDFIVDPYQVFETRVARGGGVLLIVRMLSQYQLAELIDCARELCLFVLIEAFDEADLESANTLVPRDASGANGVPVMVGVNCRDLRSLAVRPEQFAELAPRLPSHAIKVAESGIESPLDCAAAARAGYNMALVGTSLMRSREPAPLVANMLAAGRSA